jgi:3-phenylpropionate/trans-cinnamate dioxygenase ferredoxin subunit
MTAEIMMFNYKNVNAEKMEFIPVASTEEIGNGQRVIFEIDGVSIAIFNIAGEYFAIADVCSHDDGPVAEGELHDHEIECPRHGARFDIKTGEALSLPAVVDIPAYPVRVEEGEILIGLPIED